MARIRSARWSAGSSRRSCDGEDRQRQDQQLEPLARSAGAGGSGELSWPRWMRKRMREVESRSDERPRAALDAQGHANPKITARPRRSRSWRSCRCTGGVRIEEDRPLQGQGNPRSASRRSGKEAAVRVDAPVTSLYRFLDQHHRDVADDGIDALARRTGVPAPRPVPRRGTCRGICHGLCPLLVRKRDQLDLFFAEGAS